MYWLTKALSRNPRWPSEMRAKHMRGVWCCVLEVRGGAHHISRKHSSPSSWRPKERSKQSGSCTHQLLMRRAGARHHQQDRSTARGSNQRHQRHQRRFLSVGRARLSKRSRMTLNFIERGSTLCSGGHIHGGSAGSAGFCSARRSAMAMLAAAIVTACLLVPGAATARGAPVDDSEAAMTPTL